MTEPREKEITTEEMLEWLKTNLPYRQDWDGDTCLAIRRLIVEHEEWKKWAVEICEEPRNYDHTDLMAFIKEIRDFGKEGK